jgi:Co/Zn/Cd efflux system component
VDSNRDKDSKISIPPAWVLRLGLVGVLVASVLIYAYSQAHNGKPMDETFAIVLSIAAAAVGFVVSFFVEYWLANRHKSEFSNTAPINKYTILRWTLAVVGVGFGIADNAYQNRFLPVLGGMVLWGAIGLAIGLWVEHYFTKGKSDNRNINMTSLLVKVAFTLLGVGIGVIGGALWQSTLPGDFHYGESIAFSVVSLSITLYCLLCTIDWNRLVSIFECRPTFTLSSTDILLNNLIFWKVLAIPILLT